MLIFQRADDLIMNVCKICTMELYTGFAALCLKILDAPTKKNYFNVVKYNFLVFPSPIQKHYVHELDIRLICFLFFFIDFLDKTRIRKSVLFTFNASIFLPIAASFS